MNAIFSRRFNGLACKLQRNYDSCPAIGTNCDENRTDRMVGLSDCGFEPSSGL